MSAWLTDIRKTALLAAVTMVLGVAQPIWTSSRSARAQFANFSWSSFRPSDIPWIYSFLMLTVALSIMVVTIPLGFLLALYRSKVGFSISIRLRCLALLAAVASTVALLWRLFPWIHFYWTQFPQPGVLASLTVFTLEELSGLAYILFLVAIFRHRDYSAAPGAKDNRLLRGIAKTMLVLWSLVLVGIVAAAVYLAIEYPHEVFLARLYGRELPSLCSELAERARIFLTMVLIWVPPFIIHRSLRGKRELADFPSEST